MKDIILVGIQGSGKGTQAKLLAQNFGFQIFETGAVLRSMAKENSDLGQKIKRITETGGLVPNEIVMEIIEHFLETAPKGGHFIFDGIPRSEIQRETLEALLKKQKREFMALEIRLSPEEAKKRLMARAQIEGRVDDTPEIIEKRIGVYFEHTKPLLFAWEKTGVLCSLEGDDSIEKVFKKICTSLALKK